MLGERESGTARLEEAVLAFDASMPLGVVITKSHVEKSRKGACASGQEEELVPLPVRLSCTPNLEAEGYVWFSDLPNQFKCWCQGTNFDLQSMRRISVPPWAQVSRNGVQPGSYRFITGAP
jgi:hypothetical protein